MNTIKNAEPRETAVTAAATSTRRWTINAAYVAASIGRLPVASPFTQASTR
jgi:hypothetical protein